MKVLLSFGLAVLIYAGSDFGQLNQVDCTGLFYAENNNPKIINEQLNLEQDGTFEHKLLYADGVSSSSHSTSGTYKLRGNKLRLFPTSFVSNSEPVQQNKNIINTKVQRLRASNTWQNTTIIDKNTPKLFKTSLASFESGLSRLKPRYYLKQTKEQLSLCTRALKTELYRAQFTQSKVF